ncbi:MAG TPA: metalloregulator ArsR/SmtB family transcription factor [Malonomonas sp.]
MLDLFKALADQTRLRLLAILQLGEFTVQELVEILAMGQSRISRHLKILHAAGVVQVKREGTWAYYRLQPSDRLFTQMQVLLQDCWAGLEGYSRDRTALASILAARRNRSREFFDRHARQWDQMARELLPVADYLPQLFAHIPQCDKLLEVGVGTGQLLPALAEKGRQVIAVDHSPAMLAAASERLSAGGLESVALQLGQMDALPLPSGSMDVAIMNMALHHAPDPAAVIAELARVLRAGGKLVFSDLQRHQNEWVREQLADQWLGFTSEDLRDWCLDAGLQQIETDVIRGRPEELPVIVLCASK